MGLTVMALDVFARHSMSSLALALFDAARLS